MKVSFLLCFYLRPRLCFIELLSEPLRHRCLSCVLWADCFLSADLCLSLCPSSLPLFVTDLHQLRAGSQHLQCWEGGGHGWEAEIGSHTDCTRVLQSEVEYMQSETRQVESEWRPFFWIPTEWPSRALRCSALLSCLQDMCTPVPQRECFEI